MKKCPTCNKTFDDNLKFCQSDGTPLVDDAPPADPYATMVGNQADFQIPPKEEAKEPEPSVEVEVEVEVEDSQEADDVLEVPEAQEFDPMKTMVAGGNTSGNVKVDVPETEPKDPTPPVAPEPPKFDEPDVSAPDLTEGLSAPESDSKDSGEIDTPPPSPFDDIDSGDAPAAPIPSPFDKSMPPGFAPPATPPFDPTEPVKAEKVASTPPPSDVDEPKPIEDSQPSLGSTENVSPTPAPLEEWNDNPEGSAISTPSEGGEGENKTLAIVSLACGVLSMTICCSVGILLGPAAVITGFMARGKINEKPSEYGGGTFALIGMITGVVGVILFIALILLQIFSGALANLT